MSMDRERDFEDLEEFGFLLEGLSEARGIHPPREVLSEYLRGLRPEGIDPARWQHQAISTHLGLCRTCRRRLRALQRKEHFEALLRVPLEGWRRLWGGTRRWRRAYQYLGLIALAAGIVVIYSIFQSWGPSPGPGGGSPPPPPTKAETPLARGS